MNRNRSTSEIRRSRLAWIFLLGGLILQGACTSLPTGYSDFDPGTDFSTFRTFAFIPENTMIVASPNPVNPALEPTLKEEVRKHLTRQGYRYTSNPEQADFLVGFAIGGHVIVETVFSWPGMGLLMVEASASHDYPVAQGAFMMLAVVIVVLNLVADVSYGYLDPRIKVGGGQV